MASELEASLGRRSFQNPYVAATVLENREFEESGVGRSVG
jgi:hypothetical protein